MLKDRGPKYQVGFGVSPADVPTNTTNNNQEDGPNPTSSFIAKALNEHPVMRFFAVGAASLVGMHVASKIVRGGGLKLLGGLERESLHGVPSRWQQTLLHDYRSTQKTLDEWEGVTREIDHFTGASKVDTSRAGFWATRAEKERVFDAARKGLPVDDVASWTWRDEMQQTMVRQVRRLPYELPAMYATQRLVTDRMTGANPDRKTNWYNPADVISDFAGQSVRNLATTLAPWEAGQSALKGGWRDLMTYGDFATSTTTFNPHIRSFSMDLKGLLGMVGHDSSQLLYKTIQKSQQGAGAFSSAITEYNAASRDTELKFGMPPVNRVTEGGIKGSFTNVGRTIRAYGESIAKHGMDAAQGMVKQGPKSYIKNNISLSDSIHNWFPKATGFGSEFVNQWDRRGEGIASLEAMRTPGVGFYRWRGQTKPINEGLAFLMGSQGDSDVEQIADSIKNLSGMGPGHPSFYRGKFMHGRQVDEYKKILQSHLEQRGVPQSAANRFAKLVDIENLPSSSAGNAANAFNVSQRINFGDDKIVASTNRRMSDWHSELYDRIQPVNGIGKHAAPIVQNISVALQRADDEFLMRRPELNKRITSEWKDIYSGEGGLVDYAKTQIGSSKLRHSMFGEDMDAAAHKLLVHRTAQELGINTTNISGHAYDTADLLQSIGRKGFNTSDSYDMRNYLVSKGVISKPWSPEGFNILGLRKISTRDALSRKYFQHGSRASVKRLLDSMDESDAFLGGDIARPVKGVYETASGQIIDLSHLVKGGRKTMNLVEEHLQIPLLHIGLDIGGYRTFRSMAEGPMVQMRSGFADQRFIPQGQDADSLFWMRTKRSRGKVISHTLEGGIHQLEGHYRPFEADRFSQAGRTVRLAIGDKGQYTPPDSSRLGRAKSGLSFDSDQRQSIFGLLDRIHSSRKGDLRDRANFARSMLEEDVPRSDNFFNRNTERFRRDPIQRIDPSNITNEQVEAFAPFQASLRRTGLPANTSRILQELNPNKFTDIFTGIDPFSGERVDLSKIRNANEMYGIIDHTLNQHLEELERLHEINPNAYGDQVAQARQAQGLVRNRYLSDRSKSLDSSSAQAMRSTGIHRRIDELRSDFYRYAAAYEGIINGNGDQIITDLLNHLDEAKGKRLISHAEYVESRAAILSMQINLSNLSNFVPGSDRAAQTRSVIADLMSSPNSKGGLRDIANRELDVVHRAGPRKWAVQNWQKTFGRGEYEYPGKEWNPFGDDKQLVPTFGTVFNRSGWRNKTGAVSSVIGLNSWSQPQYFSGAATPVSHFYQRLNRYFATFGAGLNETDFNGPLGFFNKGLVGKRVLPAVIAGTTLTALDRSAGGRLHRKDKYGQRVYRPLIGGTVATGIAHSQVALAGMLPGGQTADEKQEELFGSGEVAIRKGRWWPLGNQPWKGGRVQYYRPSWYKRYMSGYQYTGQDWSSPGEKLMFGQDYSPGRVLSPYHWEKKHAHDRPYPVTGEYFTGPWGPATGMLNSTVGRILKPHREMHKTELNAALSDYQRLGQFAAVAPQTFNNTPLVATRNPTGSVGVFAPRTAGQALGQTSGGMGAISGGNYSSAYKQPYGFTGMPYGTSPQSAIQSYRDRSGGINTMNNYYEAQAGSQAPHRGQQRLAVINDYYTSQAQAPYNKVVMLRNKSFNPRVMPNFKPINPGSKKFQAGEYGYQAQEMFGIYGFAFAQTRHSLDFGNKDYTPQRPVLQSAARGYGTERKFWDLNLGGLGDFPNLSEGEYGNMEVSEIARRFIPHRRRDINEVNPLVNDMGKMYPWLPGNDYFINFKRGDPYIQIPEGEMRLPGAGYERTHYLHPDQTGKYGLLDQHAILGDIAPWSQEYRAIDKVVRGLDLDPSELAMARSTRKQVAGVNKRHEFSPYQYAHTNFITKQAKVIRLKPNDPDTIITDQGELRLAGARARNTEDTRLFMEDLISRGDTIKYKIDANRPSARGMPSDAVVYSNGKNVNRALLNSDYGYQAQTDAPIDNRVTNHALVNRMRAWGEELSHRNTLLNTKFMPRKSAVEDWERTEIYGSSFPQWQHPVRDFLKPIGFRAMNRNPIVAGVVLGGAGQMFSKTPEAKSVGRIVGSALGVGIAGSTDVESFDTGKRFVPLNRRKEMAVDEYSDILNYVKFSRLYNGAREMAIENEHTDPEQVARAIEDSDYKKLQLTNLGPATAQALAYRRSIKQTLYGADVYGDVMDLAAAIPKRKRDHFMDFISAPMDERPRILSTAPRLERRVYEARWGMKVERRPDLTEYFSHHELPDPSWEGWNPGVESDAIKIKIAQSQGIDVSQMGYFPQQVQEANLINPTYPNFSKQTDSTRVAAEIKQLMQTSNINGHVITIPSLFPGSRVQLSAGVH